MESYALTYQKVSGSLGLSEYEAKVYVALVMMGCSEAGKLSLESGVPRTKVYVTLRRLIEKGLVIELPGEPLRFALASPTEAFESYLSNCKDRIAEKQASFAESTALVSLLAGFHRKTKHGMELQKEEVWVLKRRSELLKKIREMLCHAESTVTVLTSEEGFIMFYRVFNRLLDRLVEKGVHVQIGTPINSLNRSLARELNYVCTVRDVNISSPLLVLNADDRAFLLSKWESDELDAEGNQEAGVYCYGPTLCGLLSLLLPRLDEKALPEVMVEAR